MSSRIPFVFMKKLTQFGSRRMIDRILCVMLVGLLLLVQTKRSHYVTHSLTRSIRSCEQGFKYPQLYEGRKEQTNMHHDQTQDHSSTM